MRPAEPATTDLHDLRWPEAEGPARILVPIGSTEQHGPHLPVATDTVVATAVARRAARALESHPARTLVAPSLGYGASGEHQDFPGTISIGEAALRTVIAELARSLRTWVPQVVFVNGHGGNTRALGLALAQLRTEGHDAAWVPCQAPDGDAHAGRTETSLMLHLDAVVALAHATPGVSAPLAEILPALRERGVRAVSPTGVLGDPTGASADEGAQILQQMTDSAVRRITAWRPSEQGMLTDPGQT